MKFQVENIVKLYRKLSISVPSPIGASIRSTSATGFLSLQTYFQVANIEQSENSTFAVSYGISQGPNNNIDIAQVGFPVELGAESIWATSKSGLQKATFRKFTGKNGEKKQILEIWSTKTKLKTFDLQSFDVHGEVCADGTFSSLQWSYDEKKLLYIAERKKLKSESFFSQKPKTDLKEESTTRKGIGHFEEEWGEQIVGRHNPAPYIFNIDEESIESLSELSDDYSCGQAVWGHSEHEIIFVAWPTKPRRLGLVFCPIRPNQLCSYNTISKKLRVLYEDSNWCSDSPRVSGDRKFMVFLNNPVGGPHFHCRRLLKMDFETNKVSVVVDMVEIPKKSDFPGLYTSKLPRCCFAVDNVHVIFSSTWRSRQEIIAINTKTGHVEKLTNDEVYGQWSLMEIFENFIVASRSSINIKPHIIVAKYDIINGKLKLGNWTPTEQESSKIISDIEWSIKTLEPEDSTDEKFEAVIARPTDVTGKIPVIVIAHGGPHSTFCPGYMLSTHLYLKLGFGLVIPNYRGSLGFGEAQLRSLTGKVGTQDVTDVQQAAEFALSLPWADSSKVVISGGSHGGFLATHIIGQYPDFYKACVCRNPVTDLRGKLEATDIPDWGWTEAGLADQYESCALPPPEVAKVLYEKSPCQYIKKVKTPLLMLLGKDDLRVPYTQGLNYYYSLKALGIADARLFVYEDNHALSKVDVASDSFVRIALFLSEKLEID